MTDTSLLVHALQHRGGVIAHNSSLFPTFQHFGDPQSEERLSRSDTVIVPLPSMIRIRVSGKDRQRFLHSFCTSDIKNLSPGAACEAFFVDVKARILAHGWILANDTCHEIWMLPGDEKQLVDHLNKYIISEDVVITSSSADNIALAFCGPTSTQLVSENSRMADTAAIAWGHFSDTEASHKEVTSFEPIITSQTVWLRLNWDDNPVVLVSCPIPQCLDLIEKCLTRNATLGGTHVFERLRIMAAIPRIGTDLTNDHLAPEARRDASAINFAKGCYLGQEPIARIDAMGHINRALCCIYIPESAGELSQCKVINESEVVLGTVSTSQRSFEDSSAVALAVLRLAQFDRNSILKLRSATTETVGKVR